MSYRTKCRPGFQILETRRCMAAAIGVDEVPATPETPAASTTIVGTTISGNTANSHGGGIQLGFAGETDRAVPQETPEADASPKAEIITGAGPGGGPHVKVFNAATNASDTTGEVDQEGNDLLIVNNGDGSDFQVDAVDEVFRQAGAEQRTGEDSFRYTIADNLGHAR